VLIGGKPVGTTPPPSYPKAILPLLPRTDFVHMLTTLPPAQQTALHARPSGGTPEFVTLVWVLCSMLERTLEDPIFQWDKWGQIKKGELLQDLTAREWAVGILAGQDRLSQTGYLEWLESRRTTLTEEVYTSRKKEAKQLDSIAGWHHKMDTRDGESLPLVEFRSLVRDLEHNEMSVTEAKAMGLKLAAYVDRLARRGIAWS